MKKDLLDRIRKEIVPGIVDAIKDCDSVWLALDEVAQEFLEESDCWLSFHGAPSVFVGVGPVDAAQSFEPEISIETYAGMPSEAQIEDLREQITAITDFIARLETARSDLQAALARAGG